MAEVTIVPYHNKYFSQVEEIFWLTSARVPEESEKAAFRKKYLDSYLDLLCFVALDSEAVQGYILCQPEADVSPKSLDVFASYFDDYPAHLHINTHPRMQGKGVGAKLLERLESELSQRGVKGVHLVTHAESRNRFFYEKNMYSPLHETAQKLLILGKKLRVKNL